MYLLRQLAGMWVSVRANARVAGAARRSAREALVVALRAGGFSGMLVVGLVSWRGGSVLGGWAPLAVSPRQCKQLRCCVCAC